MKPKSPHSAPRPPVLPPDSLAFALLAAANAVLAVTEGRTLDAALGTCWQRYSPAGPVRAAIQDLAYGTLRAGERNDFFLGILLRSPLADAQVHAVLRVTLFRLLQRPEDAHTTVDQAVNAIATLAHGNFRALANGVLRNFLRQKDELLARLDENAAARWQHPQWWVEMTQAAYPADWQAILDASNQHPPMTLRVNQAHGDAAQYVARLQAVDIAARVLGDAAVRLDKPQAVTALPGFAEGHVSVQDWGAQRAALLLDVRPGMRVLDACAAPGGKTAHLLERMGKNAIELTALELDPQRAQRIHENLQRLNLNATVKTADCSDLASWWDGRHFDRILADVPCSASGVVRRHPDIKWLRRPRDIASFALTQQRIADSLWQTLAPGGTMLYCTCSIFPTENGVQVTKFLARHKDAQRVNIANQPELQLIPTPDQDGFYYALLQKHA